MLNINNDRVILWLRDQDPDVLVDVLGVSSSELLDAFPEKVEAYLFDNCTEEEDGDEPYEDAEMDFS